MKNIRKSPVTDASAWTGDEMRARNDWVDHLSAAEIADLEHAAAEVNRKGLHWGQFGKADFPLQDATKQRLRAADRELQDGRGFVLFRGLPVERYDLDRIKTIYWGICSHLGRIMPQNVKGTMLEHITDLKVANLDDPNLRGYVTKKGLDAHADNSDTVALLCVDRADVGGKSVLVSTNGIYNKMLREHPEFVAPLYEGFRYDLRGEGVTGDLNETSDPVPIYSHHEDRVRCWFHRRLILGGAVKAGIQLSQLQRDALDYVADAAHHQDLMLEHDLQPGDIQFLNNYQTLHYRTPYEDGNGHKRLLLRMWVNREVRDKVDPAFEQSWIVAGYQARDWARDRPIAALGGRV